MSSMPHGGFSKSGWKRAFPGARLPLMSEATMRLREELSRLPATERAELAEFILESLDEDHHWVDDEEVQKRREDLASGRVKGLTAEEFWAACGQ